jgi:hypothetical protein
MMADYIVHFKHDESSDVKMQVRVPYDVDPAVAADDYEIIVELAYGIMREKSTAIDINVLGLEVRDFDAIKIMHNDDLIMDFA